MRSKNEHFLMFSKTLEIQKEREVLLISLNRFNLALHQIHNANVHKKK